MKSIYACCNYIQAVKLGRMNHFSIKKDDLLFLKKYYKTNKKLLMLANHLKSL